MNSYTESLKAVPKGSFIVGEMTQMTELTLQVQEPEFNPIAHMKFHQSWSKLVITLLGRQGQESSGACWVAGLEKSVVFSKGQRIRLTRMRSEERSTGI